MRALSLVSPVFAALLPLIGCQTAAPATGAIKVGTEGSAHAGDPAGRRFDQWLGAFNAADRAGLARAYEGDRDPEGRASMDIEVAQRSGGFDIHHVREATPTGRVVLV